MTEEKYTAEQLEQMADQLLQEAAPAQEKPAKGGLDEKTIASLPAAALLNGNEKLRDLFTKGKKKGKLDAGELSDVLDELDLESEQMDSIYDSLEQLGIEVGSEDFLADLPDEDGEPAMDEIAEIEEEELVDPNTLVDSFNIDDPVRMYLKEIGKVPLLTADQEVELATVMSAGREAEARVAQAEADGETIPEAEMAELKKQIKAGEKAKQQLAEANLRLVVSIAKRYVGRGMLFLDLIQEGSIGLLVAARKFDYTKDYRFSTYATKWIRQGVTRCLMNHGSAIRVPLHTAERMRKIEAVRTALRQELGEEPTAAQIAEKCGLPEEKVAELTQLTPDICSLDVPTGDDDGTALQSLLEDAQAPQPYEEVVRGELDKTMDQLLSTLNERQQQILRLHFGMEDGNCYSLEEIGKKLSISKERVRQIERQAMDKLQKMGTSLGLEDFLNE